MKEGMNKGRTVNIEKMMGDYWDQFGWDRTTGKPDSKCLEGLGIEET